MDNDPPHDPSLEMEQLRRERDLYLRLLELSELREIEPFLGQSLALVVELTGARNGYLELRDTHDADEAPGWHISHGFSESETADVQSRISRGILAEVLATGRTVDVASALLDPRYGERGSVRAIGIEAVLCIAIGQDPPLGALYLQSRVQPGSFTEAERRYAEIFCHHLARLADSLIVRLRTESKPDPTQPYRRTLRLSGVIGRSAALATLLQDVSRLSSLDLSLLLRGAPGSGKKQIARTMHENSPRAAHPFVAVDCASAPEPLIGNEIFGVASGGASSRRMPGKAAAAEHGTLFLDHVEELSLASQAKLLQLLRSGQGLPRGASTPRTDVRVIAATNSHLEAAVSAGRFSEDLYERLSFVCMRVPGLRERNEDIPDLARHFCQTSAAQHRLPALEFSRAAMHALVHAEWPGNISQLAKAVEDALRRAAGLGAVAIERDHVFPDRGPAPLGKSKLTFQELTRQFQAKLLRDTLDENQWNIAETARQLDIARSHVYTLIRAFGIERA